MSGNGSIPTSSSRRFTRLRPKLRQATLILPKTGERTRKTFTLRSNPLPTPPNSNEEDTPLLTPRGSTIHRQRRRSNAALDLARAVWNYQVTFWMSTTGIGIFKCSIAYTLGSLATFVPAVSNLLGRNDGKHMVATVCVYFHPARSVGSMAEATVMAWIAFAYAVVVSFSSMAVSVLFARQHLLAFGHVIVLIVFVGGGLGLVGWTKQKLGNPLVNVGCSLTSLAIITVLTKEGAIQAGHFSYNKVLQVLKMVAMGIVSAMFVNFFISPQSARQALRQGFEKITDLQEEMLTSITTSFLEGAEAELNRPTYTSVQSSYRSSFNALVKDLREAKFEHYILGTEKIHRAEKKLVKCIERLGQSLIGLRSAAETQFELIQRPNHGAMTPMRWRLDSMASTPSPGTSGIDSTGALGPIQEEPEDMTSGPDTETNSLSESRQQSSGQIIDGPADIFSLFIMRLGPAMKSLAYTLKEVLSELPFAPGSHEEITVNVTFRRSLVDAKQLFASARVEALESLYKSRAVARLQSPEMAADYEEVAASCGHFSSSLQDFADDTIAYLDILEELDTEIDECRRSWTWLYSWQNWRWLPNSLRKKESSSELRLREETAARRMSLNVPLPSNASTTRGKKMVPNEEKSVIYYYLWHMFGFLRREDVRFAIKVGLGAILWAGFAYIPETRPLYAKWRGEWGLLSYMLVCSMTIGASNTTGTQRFFGTCLGALFAIAAWIICDENPWVLGVLGWLVSLGCFYIIVGLGKGPMGRFILLTYNLSALYAYSLSAKDNDNDDDEGGISPEIWQIVLHRVVAVLVGCLWGMIVTRAIYPISARKKLKQGLSLLWLRMGLIWQRDPLSILTNDGVVEDKPGNQYMDIRESLELQRFLGYLEGLRDSASHEFELRGPFPDELMKKILEATRRMMGAFTAMNTMIVKDLKASPGELELLRSTTEERRQLSQRVSHLFSVLASSMQLAFPITDAVPSIEHTRDRFLQRLFEVRKSGVGGVRDEDYEVLYAYALVTGQIAEEIEIVGTLLEELYGTLDEESLRLR